MKPIDWACGQCAAQPGEECIWSGLIDTKGLYHSARIDTAAYWTNPHPTVKIDDFDTAVENTGLV